MQLCGSWFRIGKTDALSLIFCRATDKLKMCTDSKNKRYRGIEIFYFYYFVWLRSLKLIIKGNRKSTKYIISQNK